MPFKDPPVDQIGNFLTRQPLTRNLARRQSLPGLPKKLIGLCHAQPSPCVPLHIHAVEVKGPVSVTPVAACQVGQRVTVGSGRRGEQGLKI
jgi:hypothetical protein